MEATIIFSNGTQMEVQKNGSSYIVESEPTFPEDLSNVQIVSEEGTTIIANGKIVPCASIDSNYWFSIIEVSAQEAKEIALNQRIDDIENALCEMSSL